MDKIFAEQTFGFDSGSDAYLSEVACQGFGNSGKVGQGDVAFVTGVGACTPVGGIRVAGGIAGLCWAGGGVGCWQRSVFGLVVALTYGPVWVAIELKSFIDPFFLVFSGFFRRWYYLGTTGE